MSSHSPGGLRKYLTCLHIQRRRELAERAAQNVKEVEGAFGVLPGELYCSSSVTSIN